MLIPDSQTNDGVRSDPLLVFDVLPDDCKRGTCYQKRTQKCARFFSCPEPS